MRQVGSYTYTIVSVKFRCSQKANVLADAFQAHNIAAIPMEAYAEDVTITEKTVTRLTTRPERQMQER